MIFVAVIVATLTPSVHGQNFETLPSLGRLEVGRTDRITFDSFFDAKSKNWLIIGDAGKTIAACRAVGDGAAQMKMGRRAYSFEPPVRRWEEREFDKNTPTVLVDVFHDEARDYTAYATGGGAMSLLPGANRNEKKRASEPAWLYRLPLQVRSAGGFHFETRKCNVEVYWDEAGSALIYVAERGRIAVVRTCKPEFGFQGKRPEWAYGVDVRVRKLGQQKFASDSAEFGMEVFHDPNAKTWVYIAQTLQIGVVPGAMGKCPITNPKLLEWKTGVRPKGAGGWCAELYHDLNTDYLIYITSEGAIAVAPSKR